MGPVAGMMLGMGGGKLLSGILGGLFGGGGNAPTFPDATRQLFFDEYNRTRKSGYTLNKNSWDESARENVAGILATLPVSSQNYEANLASRGIGAAGEAAKYYYSDVVAPVTRAATQAMNASEIDFAKLSSSLNQMNLNRILSVDAMNTELAYKDYLSDVAGNNAFWSQIGESAGLIGGGFALNQAGGFGAYK